MAVCEQKEILASLIDLLKCCVKAVCRLVRIHTCLMLPFSEQCTLQPESCPLLIRRMLLTQSVYTEMASVYTSCSSAQQ